MIHYSADDATVTTSSGFTPSARRLSATTGVVLLLHTEIDRFDKLLAEGGPAREPLPSWPTSASSGRGYKST